MYYVKGKHNRKIVLEDGDDGNIFGDCPRCGRPHHVDLKAILSTESDLYSSSFCRECSKIVLREQGEEPTVSEGRFDGRFWHKLGGRKG